MKGISLIALTILAGLSMGSTAKADYSAFLAATCGPGCEDPIGEQTVARENWAALRALGTVDFIGAQVDGQVMDASALLAAARQVGASELDRWLRTGGASSESVVADISAALRIGAGLDVFRVIGNYKPKQAQVESGRMSFPAIEMAAAQQTIDLGAFQSNTGLGPGGGSSAYCDQTIDSAQNASAQNYVNEVMEAAYSKEYGFSQTGGISSGSNSHSPNGLFGGSCLDLFMTGDKDTLFKPPQLPQLLTMLTQMFGKSGQAGGFGGVGGGQQGSDGACAGAPTVFEQVENSMPSAVFTPGKGGFHPTFDFGGSESPPNGLQFSNNYGIDLGKFQSGATQSNLLGIF